MKEEEAAAETAVAIRELDTERDGPAAEAVERMCEVGPSGKISLFTDTLGDPVCRVRHSPAFLMLVAETCGPERQIVGLVRGCIKTVTCGHKQNVANAKRHGMGTAPSPIFTKLAYILGLRVSPSHRRMGIALKLVAGMEQWFRERGAEYAYMATEKDNHASVSLFTGRFGYRKFRTPSILVNPVAAGHRLPLPRRVALLRLPPSAAAPLYRRRFSAVEFFPRDIDAVLSNPLSLGTFLAVPSGFAWAGPDAFLARPPESWAVLSVWNSKEVFRLQVRGASTWRKGLARASRALDRVFPWLGIPSVPNIFRPFGFYFLYGIGGEGPQKERMVRALCGHAHNMAREGKCELVVAEVGACEPLRAGIPHWKRLGAEDLWCVKRLAEDYSDGEVGDWTKAPPGPSIFVDPREL